MTFSALDRRWWQNAIVVAAAIAVPVPADASAPVTETQVYILAGQSNMSGRGRLTDLSDAEQVPDRAIRVYGNDGRWRAASEPLDDATGQVDDVSADRQAAVGPGLFFARAMTAKGARAVALVPCAKGGSSIGRWAPGGSRETLYGSCLARVREAGGRVAGVLWYQGESDGGKAVDAASRWDREFHGIVDAFRRDLGLPDLPIAMVQISDRPARAGDEERYPGWTTVQARQASFSQRCVAMVPTAGLPRREDDLHLSTSAQRTLGTRLADAISRLQRRCR